MQKRTSIYSKGFSHKNPIPNACRIGNIIASGLVVGMDPATGKPAETMEEQCAYLFRYIREIVEESGGTTEDIIKITLWLKDRDNRGPVNTEWAKMFPDENNRPARQAMSAPDLEGGKLIQADFMAVVG